MYEKGKDVFLKKRLNKMEKAMLTHNGDPSREKRTTRGGVLKE